MNKTDSAWDSEKKQTTLLGFREKNNPREITELAAIEIFTAAY